MRAGNLRHRVTIQQLVAGSPNQNAGGEPEEAWSDVATVYGAIRPLKGREFLSAQQTSSEVTGVIDMRYRAGITSKMRCMFGERLFDIVSVVDPDERHIRLELSVRELANDG